MVKQDKFTHDLRERQAEFFNFLWRYAKEIKFEYPGGFSEWTYIDDPSEFEKRILEQMAVLEDIKKDSMG